MENDLTQGPITHWLYKLTTPMVLGIMAIFLFNLVDTYFVSLLGTEALAAISFTFPATMMVTNLAIGLSIATGALVSKAIGQKNPDQTRNLVNSSFYLSITLGLVVAAVGYCTQEWVFALMGAEAQLVPLIREYLDLWYLGCALLVTMITVNASIRATGDTKLPSIIMLVSAMINGILDPLLIFGIGPFPELGIQGAALATVISWLLAFLMVARKLYVINLLSFSIPEALIKNWKQLLKLGIPASLTNMLGPLANGVLVAWVALYGTHAVAAYGVGSRLEPMLLIVAMAFTASLPPFVGQNFGAKKTQRIEQAVKTSMFFIIAWQLVLYLILITLAAPISALFSDDASVQHITQTFLYILPISYTGLGVCLICTATLNALHKPKYSLMVTIFRLFILYIPLAALGNLWLGLNGIFWGCALGNLIIGAYMLFMFYKVTRTPQLLNKVIQV